MKRLKPTFKPEDLEIAEDTLTQLIEQLNIKNFTNACDITIENLRDFLVSVLQAYQDENFFLNTLTDIGEWLRIYIFNYYKNSEDFVCISKKDDPLFPGLFVVGMMEGRVDDIEGFFWMAQEDVLLTLEFLKAPIEKQAQAYDKLWLYLKSINRIDRSILYEGAYVPRDSLCGKDKIHIDVRRSVSKLQLAADQGDARAQCNLGVLLEQEDNLEEAKKWYQLAAGQGDLEAQCHLGWLLKKEGRIEEAKAWYQLAADQGDARGQCNVGWLLQKEGKLEEAKKWQQLAANQGNVHGQSNLGWLLQQEGKLEEAKAWYQLAADQGNAHAHANLGYLLQQEGKLEEAKKLYQLSADQGNAYGQSNLGYLLEQEGKLEEAKKLYQLSADQGNAYGQSNLGYLLEQEGKLEEAKKLYQLSADQGNAYGQSNLNHLLEKEKQLDLS